ncbi:helix-turn-helix transcriptional regulator [Mycetocola reblochoni]|uniref:helix-turn-helix transcriptional regulator n=1 Tax=Mycetocola reblochoni TaxID=331618 RepID=UPI003F956E36
MSTPPLATPGQVADWLGCSTRTLARMRYRGEGPAYITSGRTIRYAWPDVHRWAADNRTARGVRR